MLKFEFPLHTFDDFVRNVMNGLPGTATDDFLNGEAGLTGEVVVVIQLPKTNEGVGDSHGAVSELHTFGAFRLTPLMGFGDFRVIENVFSVVVEELVGLAQVVRVDQFGGESGLTGTRKTANEIEGFRHEIGILTRIREFVNLSH